VNSSELRHEYFFFLIFSLTFFFSSVIHMRIYGNDWFILWLLMCQDSPIKIIKGNC
jgi:hypothetical protein